MSNDTSIIPIERIKSAIYILRGHKIMLDRDLAALYGGQTKALVQAVKRNIDRFPADFMFILSPEEAKTLRSQSSTLDKGRGRHSKYLPHAFTEEGVGMLSSVLRSPRAVAMNIAIIRAFVLLRRFALTNEELSERLAALEKKLDGKFKAVFDEIRKLFEPTKPKPTLGFARKKIS